MGEQKVRKSSEKTETNFVYHLLNDIEALSYMLKHDMIEKGITRIGAEQEFCLVTKDWRPTQNADAILEEINDPHLTNELASYNLEINLDPFELKQDCFTKAQNQLDTLLKKSSVAAHNNETNVVLTGILPTISKTHLKSKYITDKPRYHALNESLMKLRGSNFHLHLMGVDELSIQHNSVLFEACNTSFQLHLQIDPADFIASFNWSQAISGPILAACTNSPLLLGRELWHETRIALFRQSIDTRHISLALKDQLPRVSFGSKWATGSILEIYKENIAYYKTVLETDIEEDSLTMVKEGKTPKLKALSLHNGTIYPWNRACYGVGGGKAHLRIENRYIPAGPTTIDAIANFVLWVGIMVGRPKKYDQLSDFMDFKEAKGNFIKAARNGMESIQYWEGNAYTAKDLLIEKLIPWARQGLQKVSIDKKDIDFYLSIIEKRLHTQTGSQWMIKNFRTLQTKHKIDEALRIITEKTYENQQQNLPISQWPSINPMAPLNNKPTWVGHIMSTRLLTVKETDLAALALRIMEWRNIHHMLVENEEGKLSGLLTWTHVKDNHNEKEQSKKIVKNIMVKNIITVKTTTPISEAIALMKENKIGCLPVLQNGELTGIVTVKDLVNFDQE